MLVLLVLVLVLLLLLVVVSRQHVAQPVAMIPVEPPHVRLLRCPAWLSAGHSRMHDEWMQIYLAPQL